MNNPFRPYKSDIKQIENLVKLGCHESDICGVLNITQSILNKWKSKNKIVDDILKPKPRPEFTLNHPDFAPMVEEAFVCAGKRFYRFKEEYRMSTGRYHYYYATLRELEMKMGLEKLKEYVEAFKKVLNGGGKKKSIELTDLHKLVINLETRIGLEFDPTIIKKLAAVAYFDDTEDITSYNDKYGKEKVKLWEEHNLYAFFLTKPIGELWSVNVTSADYLQEQCNQKQEIVRDLDLLLQQVSEVNS
jgi:hypothetical protein